MIKDLAISDDKGSNADFAKAMYEAYLYFKGLRAVPGPGSRPSATRTPSRGGRYDSACRALVRAQLRHLHRQRLARKAPRTTTRWPCCTAAGGNTPPLYAIRRSVRQEHRPGELDGRVRALHARRRRQQPATAAGHRHPHGGGDRRVERRPLSELHAQRGQPGRRHLPQRQRRRRRWLKALREIFNEIQAVNSVFASASLPVSVNARGTYLNQVYMGMFRPDGERASRAGAAT